MGSPENSLKSIFQIHNLSAEHFFVGRSILTTSDGNLNRPVLIRSNAWGVTRGGGGGGGGAGEMVLKFHIDRCHLCWVPEVCVT